MTAPATQAPVLAPSVSDFRHKAEIPMLIFAGFLTLAGVITAISAAIAGSDIPSWALLAGIGLVLPAMAALILIRYNYWKEVTNAVEITPTQLPEIYGFYKELADQMDVTPTPRLYLRNGNGALNAYASKCTLYSKYVVIYSDLLDIAYRNNDFDGVKFVLAHELGHIKCGHVDLWRIGITALPTKIKIGASVSRAQEYTADRCAAYYAPEGAKSMMVLVAGKNMYPHCDLDAYLETIDNHKHGFWMKLSNFLADHAVGMRRIPPLANIERDGWDQHGNML